MRNRLRVSCASQGCGKAQLQTRVHIVFWLCVLVCAAGLLAGCGGSSEGEAGRTVFVRTPRPTFTPTPPPAAPEQAADQADAATNPPAEANTAARGGPLLEGNPQVIVNSPFVNIRSGPGVDFDIVVMVERGEEYVVIGKSNDGTWWNICCVEGTSAWIIDEFVDVNGPTDQVPVTEGEPPISVADLQPTPTVPPPTPTQPPAVTPTPVAAPQVQPANTADAFALIDQEQFPETGVVRVFLYVYAGNKTLAGYSLRVRKDGVELPVNAVSFGGQPAFTWPFADARQRFQNMKVEFADLNPAGTWDVVLIGDDKEPLGPAATFVLQLDDPNRELYVRYERK